MTALQEQSLGLTGCMVQEGLMHRDLSILCILRSLWAEVVARAADERV